MSDRKFTPEEKLAIVGGTRWIDVERILNARISALRSQIRRKKTA